MHEFKPSGEHVYNYIATLGQASTGVLNFIFCGAALAAPKYFMGLHANYYFNIMHIIIVLLKINSIF